MIVIIWHILATGKPYHELGSDSFTRRMDPERETRRLIAKPEALGHAVTLHGGPTIRGGAGKRRHGRARAEWACSTVSALPCGPEAQQGAGPAECFIGRCDVNRNSRHPDGRGASQVHRLVVQEHHIRRLDAQPVSDHPVYPWVWLQDTHMRAVNQGVGKLQDSERIHPFCGVKRAQVVGENADGPSPWPGRLPSAPGRPPG